MLKPSSPAHLGRIQLVLFGLCFVAYGYFHQGGGWNQNARFAMVRSMVEQGQFNIDNYLIYEPSGQGSLRRIPVAQGSFTKEGVKHQLIWTGLDNRPQAITGENLSGASQVHIQQVAATGDMGFAEGHVHPNKAPGTAFLGVPAYLILYHTTRLLGLNPDAHGVLTVNAWLTNLFSVGLLSALTVVLFFRLALLLFNCRISTAWAASVAFAFGTMWFPYATLFQESNLTAGGLLAAFYFVTMAGREKSTATKSLVMAGLCGGVAVLTNYLAAIPVALMGLIGLFRLGLRPMLFYGLGGLAPFIMLCVYNYACFGTLVTTNYRYQNPIFMSPGNVMGIFDGPSISRLVMLLFSPFRGLFYTSPILLAGLLGWFWALKNTNRRPAGIFALAMFGFYLLFNISFEGWHGGWAVVPRYLAPAVPFLALGMVPAFSRFFKTCTTLALISILSFGIITAVDPQSPLGNNPSFSPSGIQWQINHFSQYLWPTLWEGRPEPIIKWGKEAILKDAEAKLSPQMGPSERIAAIRQLASRLEQNLEPGVPGFPPSLIAGPVSVNPMGIYEGWFWMAYQGKEGENRWNAFNAGEWLFPASVLSLLPLIFLAGFLIIWGFNFCTKTDRLVEREAQDLTDS